MSYHIQVNQNCRMFHFATIKIFVLIISGKISGKCSGKLHMGIFNQLSEMQFLITKKFSDNYE